MKLTFAILLALLVATNIALLVKQVRVEDQLRTVQQENSRLSQDLASRPLISPSEYHQAQRDIERAAQIMDAVETRLTNASAILTTLRTASNYPGFRPHAAFVPRGWRSSSDLGSLEPPGLAEIDPLPFLPQTLIESSSHTPDGKLQQRSWGPEQVVGPPDTKEGGDISTAWAPRNSTGSGEEWLHLGYDHPVDVSEINVRETYNPGAISKVAAVMPDGREVVVWEGTEPAAKAPVDMSFPVPNGVQAQSVKVYLDRSRVAGWNEIDAVELVGRDGTRQWASSAKASSSYAER